MAKIHLFSKKNEATPPRDTWGDLTLESTGLAEKIIHSIEYVIPEGCTVEIYDEQPNADRDDQMIDIKFKVRISFDDNAAFVYDCECTQTYTGAGEFGMYASPYLTMTPSKESDFPVDTSKTLTTFPGGSLAFSSLSAQIRKSLSQMSDTDLFKVSPKLGTIYCADNPKSTIYPRLRNSAIEILYPEEDTEYPEFDYDTADSILRAYFDDFMLSCTKTLKGLRAAVKNGRVFKTLDEMVWFAQDLFAKEYSLDIMKDIVIDAIENAEPESEY